MLKNHKIILIPIILRINILDTVIIFLQKWVIFPFIKTIQILLIVTPIGHTLFCHSSFSMALRNLSRIVPSFQIIHINNPDIIPQKRLTIFVSKSIVATFTIRVKLSSIAFSNTIRVGITQARQISGLDRVNANSFSSRPTTVARAAELRKMIIAIINPASNS